MTGRPSMLGEFARVSRYLHIEQTPCIPNGDDWIHGLSGDDQDDGFALLVRLRELLEGRFLCGT